MKIFLSFASLALPVIAAVMVVGAASFITSSNDTATNVQVEPMVVAGRSFNNRN